MIVYYSLATILAVINLVILIFAFENKAKDEYFNNKEVMKLQYTGRLKEFEDMYFNGASGDDIDDF